MGNSNTSRAGRISPLGGAVAGIGLEGNGWTNVLFAASGGLLILATPTDVGARAVAVLVGVASAAAAAVALVDGEDVFGVFAANGWTVVAWAVVAIVLLALAAIPRTRAKGAKDGTVAGPPREEANLESVERELLGPRNRQR